MKALLSFVVAGLVFSVAQAEVKPDRTVLDIYCGPNELESWIETVCLTRVQGFNDLTLIKLKDTKGKTTLVPVIRTTVQKQNNKSLKVEKLATTEGETEKDERGYELLMIEEATLKSKFVSGGAFLANEISGRVAGPRGGFKASLQGIVHTESVGNE